MKLIGGLVVAVLLLTACGGGSNKSTPKTAASAVATTSAAFATTDSRDKTFLAALQASPYVAQYQSQTQEDLTTLGAQECTDIETGHGVQTVVRAMNITSDEDAQKFLVRTSIMTYCPNLADALPNLIGN